MSPSKYRAKSRQGSKRQAKGQTPVMNVTRKTWLLNFVSSQNKTVQRTRIVTRENVYLETATPAPAPSLSMSYCSCHLMVASGSSRSALTRKFSTGRRQFKEKSSTLYVLGKCWIWITSGTTSWETLSVRTATPRILTGPPSTSASSSASSAPASTET